MEFTQKQKLDLIDELKEIRKGPGFVKENMPKIDSVFIKVISGKNPFIFDVAKERVTNAIMKIPNTKDREALLAVYALKTEPEYILLQKVTERRELCAKQLGIQKRMMYRYEDNAIDQLATQLLEEKFSNDMSSSEGMPIDQQEYKKTAPINYEGATEYNANMGSYFKLPVHQKPLSVFISYSWEQSSSADEIEKEISKFARIIRDKNEIEVWGSLTEFMQRIRKEDFAVLLISDEYLKSINCMYEVSQLVKDENWHRRVMYIVFENAKNIYDPFNRSHYINYWEEYRKKLEKQQKIVSFQPQQSYVDDHNKVCEIQHSIEIFLKDVKDRINPEMDTAAEEIKNRIENNRNTSAAVDFGKKEKEMSPVQAEPKPKRKKLFIALFSLLALIIITSATILVSQGLINNSNINYSVTTTLSETNRSSTNTVVEDGSSVSEQTNTTLNKPTDESSKYTTESTEATTKQTSSSTDTTKSNTEGTPESVSDDKSKTSLGKDEVAVSKSEKYQDNNSYTGEEKSRVSVPAIIAAAVVGFILAFKKKAKK